MDRTKQLLALTGSLIVAIQIIIILVSGSSACLNDGCKTVESLTVISPLVLNLIGFLYFQTVFWTLVRRKNHERPALDWPKLLLFAGLAVETVLFAYQLIVVGVFCAYCLTIFAFILALNLLSGMKQIVYAATLTVAVVLGFSVLSFMPVPISPQSYALEKGIFGTRTCSAPTKEVHLIFSANCPHCANVLEALEECNSCDLHLNPVTRVNKLDFDDIEINEDYAPRVNRMVLSVFGIEEVPVLLVKNNGGYRFIKGERNIINYIRHACFNQEPTFYLDSSRYSDPEKITAYSQEQGECAIQIDCD